MSYFYQKGIDITNDKQMFNFLKNHFEYWTMNSWNFPKSIANNVKLYNLNLTGDWSVALSLLETGEYDEISMILLGWEREHRGYEVCFNGRCGGYLVLKEKASNEHILPDEIVYNDTYEDYKAYCRDEFGSVKANRSDLVFYTKLVQDFDKLCDQLRDYCDQLSRQSFEIIEMQRAVEVFNEDYADDLEMLGFDYLRCDAEGIVDLSEIIAMQSLTEAFLRVAKRVEEGYGFEWPEENRIRLKKM